MRSWQSINFYGSCSLHLHVHVHLGYSAEVDDLRDSLRNNEEIASKLCSKIMQVNFLSRFLCIIFLFSFLCLFCFSYCFLSSLNFSLSSLQLWLLCCCSNDCQITKLLLVSHKSYGRVFETTKAQSTRASNCSELIR